MRGIARTLFAATFLAVPPSLWAQADDPPANPPADPTTTAPRVAVPARRAGAAVPPPVIGSHQINRYEAVRQLQEKLRADPKSLADWVILGELAHEVAVNAPPDQAARYATISRDAYEKALTLAPDNAGLKAAVQFARSQEAGNEQFEQTRARATTTYLDARRRDLAATNYNPVVPVYAPQAPVAQTPAPDTTVPDTEVAPAVTPAPEGTTSTDTANYGTRQLYSYPYYQPFYTNQPYTFQQYTTSYFPPNYYGGEGTQPITLQRYVQQFPRAMSGRAVVPAR